MSVEEILLWVGRDDFLPRRSRSRDILGNVTTLLFLRGESSVKLDPEIFRFDPPPGTEIVEGLHGHRPTPHGHPP
jgi:outer membrane lipoprotein-sorting protein